MSLFSRTKKNLNLNFLSGLTLVEVLVAIAVLSLLAISVSTVLNISDMAWNTDMGLVDLQQQTRQAMVRMVREIRQADSVISASGTTITFSTPWTATDSITYRLEGKQITREYPSGSGTKSILGNNINSLDFVHGSCVVEIELQAQKTVRGRTIIFPVSDGDSSTEDVLTEKVKLRN